MQKLGYQLSHLFHYVDTISMITLISLEDFVKDEIDFTSLHRKRCLEDIEKWSHGYLKKLRSSLKIKN